MKRVSSEYWLGGRKRGKPVDRQTLPELLENVAITHQHSQSLPCLANENKINTEQTDKHKNHTIDSHVLCAVNAVFWASFLLVDSLKGTN